MLVVAPSTSLDELTLDCFAFVLQQLKRLEDSWVSSSCFCVLLNFVHHLAQSDIVISSKQTYMKSAARLICKHFVRVFMILSLFAHHLAESLIITSWLFMAAHTVSMPKHDVHKHFPDPHNESVCGTNFFCVLGRCCLSFCWFSLPYLAVPMIGMQKDFS
jgi:hypothetical protein